MTWYAFNMSELSIRRPALAHRGRRLEYFTIVWNGLEGLVAVAAGIIAGSVSLVAFGMDSFIEVRQVPHCFGECPLMRTLRARTKRKTQPPDCGNLLSRPCRVYRLRKRG